MVLASLRKTSLLGKGRHLSLLFEHAECLPALSIAAGVCRGAAWPRSRLARTAANAACPASSRERWDKGSTKGADFTAGRSDGLFSEGCAVCDDARGGGTRVEFPMLAGWNRTNAGMKRVPKSRGCVIWGGLTSVRSCRCVVLHGYKPSCSVLAARWLPMMKPLCCWTQWWKGDPQPQQHQHERGQRQTGPVREQRATAPRLRALHLGLVEPLRPLSKEKGECLWSRHEVWEVGRQALLQALWFLCVGLGKQWGAAEESPVQVMLLAFAFRWLLALQVFAPSNVSDFQAASLSWEGVSPDLVKTQAGSPGFAGTFQHSPLLPASVRGTIPTNDPPWDLETLGASQD